MKGSGRGLILSAVLKFSNDTEEECRLLGLDAEVSCKVRRHGGTYRLRHHDYCSLLIILFLAR
jgi:hypothetical protein